MRIWFKVSREEVEAKEGKKYQKNLPKLTQMFEEVGVHQLLLFFFEFRSMPNPPKITHT